MDKFTPSIIKNLGYYVYTYSDPETNEVFYVGKGRANRVFDHLTDESESKKVEKIKQLQARKLKPKIELLAHGLDEETAFKIEAAAIDLIGLSKLTNAQAGHYAANLGRMNLSRIYSIYQPEKAVITEPSLLIRINQSFFYGITEQEIYDATRGIWKIGANREKVKLAFAIFGGVIQEVYEVAAWFKAGTTLNSRGVLESDTRWEFVGNIAHQSIRKKYLYKTVEDQFPSNSQNPIKYLNIHSEVDE